ncbi:MAG TPA: efflux transporter outer membrane subunit [Noviherbaspirillum sp.]|nr:efflux transporter outer membrane subunit [Noviherbaspirillum sp.]
MKTACKFIVPALLLAGCAAVQPPPPYQRPDLGLTPADTFAAAPGEPTQPTSADLLWWRRFDDPAMTQWVEQALAGNLEVAAAFERVEQAQALLRRASAERGPVLGARGQIGVNRRSGGAGRTSGTSGSAGTTTGGVQTNGATAGAGLSIEWNADLWGGLRQAEASAAASLLRSEDLAQAARLATAGTAARGYIEWREAQNEWQVLEQTLRLREDMVRLVRVRVDVGLSPAIDLTRAQADLAAVQAERDAAAGRARQAEVALHVLAGRRPSATTPLPQADARIPDLAGVVPVPRPVDLLRLRPDVRAAERALIAAYADVGVARAALYPTLRLPGDLLVTAAGLGTGSIVQSVTASLGAILDATLIDGGRRAADVDAARSRAREAALVYERTVLEALEQVESALIARETITSELQARRAAAETATQALEQARAMYTEGLAGFADVLEAQRTWLANRLEFTRGEAAAARAAIASFEAIGVVDPGQMRAPA